MILNKRKTIVPAVLNSTSTLDQPLLFSRDLLEQKRTKKSCCTLSSFTISQAHYNIANMKYPKATSLEVVAKPVKGNLTLQHSHKPACTPLEEQGDVGPSNPAGNL